MRQELKHRQIFYLVSLNQFLACASFGKVSFFKHSLDRDPYIDFLEAQLVLHLRRMAPSMGPNYSVGPGPFKTYFERQEEHAWEIISHFASLLSPAYYLPEDLVGSRVLFPSCVKEDLVGSRVLFPSVVKEDLVRCHLNRIFKDPFTPLWACQLGNNIFSLLNYWQFSAFGSLPAFTGTLMVVFASTSAPLLICICTELKLSNPEVGRLAISVSLISDVAAMILLVAIPMTANFANHGLPPDIKNTDSLCDPDIICLCHASESLRPHFELFISDITRRDGWPPACIIADVFLKWTVEVAKEASVFHCTITTCEAYGTMAVCSLWQHLPHVGIDAEEFHLCGFSYSYRFWRSQMSQCMRAVDGEDPWSAFLRAPAALCALFAVQRHALQHGGGARDCPPNKTIHKEHNCN
ncbi:hypothetical protein Taro_026202 [Colocasia esculenta]|uniref:Uncharacterized protein n=1 Tax=Colocasia esculenta TaxID=4460 RepID=A0A843VAT6_COLES|nr:hypothetical protein [Colocasia esculenta]